MKRCWQAIFGVLVLFLLGACGGGGGGGGGDGNASDVTPPSENIDPSQPSTPPDGGSAVITSDNYVDVAGLTIVASDRVAFLIDLVDLAFETVIDTGDNPGTHPCLYGGTVSYARSGSNYTFTVINCDTSIAGERLVLQSGSMRVQNVKVQETRAGYFLTSAALSFHGTSIIQGGASTVYNGAVNMSATVTSETSSSVQTGGQFQAARAGRTDSYEDVEIALASTLYQGSWVDSGRLTLVSPRAPGNLSISAENAGSSFRFHARASDGSGADLATTDGANYTLDRVENGAVITTESVSRHSHPLAGAISRALQ